MTQSDRAAEYRGLHATVDPITRHYRVDGEYHTYPHDYPAGPESLEDLRRYNNTED